MTSHIWVPLLAVISLLLPLGRATDVILADRGNTCPDDYSQITSLAECRVAVDMLHHKAFQGEETAGDWPRGCYKCTNVDQCENGAWFNHHMTGSSQPRAQLYCAKNLTIVPNGTLFIGDSDIDYWKTTVAFPSSYNIGIGGRTCKDVLTENSWMLSNFNPSRVVLVCGENDLDGKSVKKTFWRLRKLVRQLTRAGVRVTMVSTKPEPGTRNLHRKYRRYDRKIKRMAKYLARNTEVPPLVFIDSYGGFKDMGNPRSLYAGDRLHLSATGYGHWNEWVGLALNNADDCVVWRSGECKYPTERRLSVLV